MFKKMKSGLAGLKSKLARTHNAIMGSVEGAFTGKSREEVLEMLEESLITADIGVETSLEIVERLRGTLGGWDPERLKKYLQDYLYEILKDVEKPLTFYRSPFVVMVLGVNGVGKTTTIGKLAALYRAQGKTVVLGAGDTFRAAAVEQLEIWGERTGCDVVKQTMGADPGAVAYDAINAAIGRYANVVLLDTAGRLHTKANLMDELKKVKRVASRELPDAPHENLLVLDASTGQNALNQARLFNEAVGVTGIVLTKLDGTAKGGIIVPIARELKIPIRFIGVGEGVDDLKEFYAREFVEAII
ncbi:MAG TPA: signal recognition particle-docking protein FtsY [Thermodesulfobacteriota bacterium]|nr:signal recognition particle-docking protein FtsY [Thermodesulfobacteriota bacterium]